MRILCIGDSNTWGYDPVDGFRHKNRWTRVLAGLMPEHEIIEEGLNGRTILSIDPYMPERCLIHNLRMILMSNKPVDMVVLMVGSNELKNIFPCKASYIAQGIEECVKIILDKDMWDRFNVPKVLIVSPILIRDEMVTNGGTFAGEFDETSVRESKLLAEEYKKVCEKYQLEFIDAAKYAEASLVDNLHMDEENHRKLGEALYDRLRNAKLYNKREA
ncbi:MAG: GDSL family lipase [Lachnospiraceae bacterium]|nr:GDSL family lipase [Lachnospiraceae bacterium]